MPSRIGHAWRRLARLPDRIARPLERLGIVLCVATLVLAVQIHPALHGIEACLVVADVVALVVLPWQVEQIRASWRRGTQAKHRVRILRAHVAELEELNAELRRLADGQRQG